MPLPKSEKFIWKDSKLVRCELCGEYYKSITNTHLRHKHGMSRDEYLEHFPTTNMTSNGTRKKCGTASDKGWSIPGQHEYMSKTLSEIFSTPERRDQRSRIAKELAAKGRAPYDVKTIKKRAKIVKKILSDSEHKAATSIRMKQLWSNPEYRKKMLTKMREIGSDPIHREKLSVAKKKNWADPNHTYNTPEYRKKTWRKNKS